MLVYDGIHRQNTLPVIYPRLIRFIISCVVGLPFGAAEIVYIIISLCYQIFVREKRYELWTMDYSQMKHLDELNVTE